MKSNHSHTWGNDVVYLPQHVRTLYRGTSGTAEVVSLSVICQSLWVIIFHKSLSLAISLHFNASYKNKKYRQITQTFILSLLGIFFSHLGHLTRKLTFFHTNDHAGHVQSVL